jgi:hypothetical protein
MGSQVAQGYANAIKELGISLDLALLAHLQSNHYPPIPACMVEPCKAAIVAANQGEYWEMIDLPAGVTFKGRTRCTADDIIQGHHLEAFLVDPDSDPDQDDEDDEDKEDE